MNFPSQNGGNIWIVEKDREKRIIFWIISTGIEKVCDWYLLIYEVISSYCFSHCFPMYVLCVVCITWIICWIYDILYAVWIICCVSTVFDCRIKILYFSFSFQKISSFCQAFTNLITNQDLWKIDRFWMDWLYVWLSIWLYDSMAEFKVFDNRLCFLWFVN